MPWVDTIVIIDKHALPMYQLLLNVHVESSVGDEWIFYANQTSICLDPQQK